MNETYNRLQDEESRRLYEARISYLFNRDADEFIRMIDSLYAVSDWRSDELEEKICEVNPKGIIIFGCGHDGRRTKEVLSLCGYEISYFCDNYKNSEIAYGKKVLSVGEVVESYKDHLIIIASSRYGQEMYIELVERGFPHTNIILSGHISRLLFAERGRHYFDVFQPETEEIYIDAGMYDGDTILGFNQWTNGTYKKIYAFEPIKEIYDAAYRRIGKVLSTDMTKMKIINAAAWNKNEELHFTEMDSASWQCNDGKTVVQGLKIDSVVEEKEKVTFIKMDIEGSELKALEGARKTIINHYPRLAICIYHNPLDIIEIPTYILKLVPEYKFYIRHYGSQIGDEVLYAVVDNS